MFVASRAILSNFFGEQGTQTTHNTFRDCRVHFFRQTFSKQLYTATEDSKPAWLATESC